MKELLRRVIYELLSYINKIIPKSKGQILLYSNSELSDSCEAIALYLLANRNYNIWCFTTEKQSEEQKYRGIKYTNNLIHLVWIYFRSQVIIETHTGQIKMRPTRKQYVLQIWHGTPIKEMHYDISPIFNRNLASFYTGVSYPSERYKVIMANLFGAKESQMILTGYPRNDLLFSSDPINYLDIEKYDKMIVWLPTFRNASSIGLGNRFEKSIPIINDENIKELDNYLRAKNVLLILKPHPLQDMFFVNTEQISNIKIIYNKDLSEVKVPLYKLLSKSDALLSDFSSVVYDYALLDRPIGFCIDDFDEYKKIVGFSDINIDEIISGPLITTIEELEIFIDDICHNKDDYKVKRRHLRNISNYYVDSNSSKRCVDAFEKYFEKQ